MVTKLCTSPRWMIGTRCPSGTLRGYLYVHPLDFGRTIAMSMDLFMLKRTADRVNRYGDKFDKAPKATSDCTNGALGAASRFGADFAPVILSACPVT